MDEIGEIVKEWNVLHDPDADEGAMEMTSPEDFLGGGGERL